MEAPILKKKSFGARVVLSGVRKPTETEKPNIDSGFSGNPNPPVTLVAFTFIFESGRNGSVAYAAPSRKPALSQNEYPLLSSPKKGRRSIPMEYLFEGPRFGSPVI